LKLPNILLPQLSRTTASSKSLTHCFTPGNEVLAAAIEFVDIAGLVRGAHQGEGLGNQFLSHIRETTAMVEVVRAFEDVTVPHPEFSLNPERDIQTIEEELILADLEMLERALPKWQSGARAEEKEAAATFEALKKAKDLLAAGKPLRGNLAKEEMRHLKQFNFLTAKPILFVLNVAEKSPPPAGNFISLPLKLLAEVADLSPEEAQIMLKDFGFKENPLNQLARKAYELLDLITFYTVKPPQTRAWAIERGRTLPEAGGIIHSDFQEKFIRAEVINIHELLKIGSWSEAKAKGRVRTEGKDAIVADGDVIEFKI